jgi:hypothetical protein
MEQTHHTNETYKKRRIKPLMKDIQAKKNIKIILEQNKMKKKIKDIH